MELEKTRIREALIGAVAGLGATVPMTAAMEALFKSLPTRERYPLPPRQIAMGVAEAAGVKEKIKSPRAYHAYTCGSFRLRRGDGCNLCSHRTRESLAAAC
jgi:hypothetical protein